MKKILFITMGIAALTMFSACDDNENGSQVDAELNSQILSDFSVNVAQASYNDLKSKASALNENIKALASDGGKTTEKLDDCRAGWKAARQAWEQTESFLFGPVSTGDVDPRIDTWPVDFNVLQQRLDGNDEFTAEYIGDLLPEQKGFHAIEYLIFGEEGNKTAAGITSRELEFLTALGLNLKALTSEVAEAWNPEAADNYHDVFVSTNQKDAFVQLVTTMAEICGEVGEGKINDVYQSQDPSMEESPFSKNSITDFTNNIIGVRNVYLGKYSTDGKGLEDLVKKHNLQLDLQIKTAIDAAITSLNNITDPFGEAIISQPNQVKNAVDAINALEEILDDGDTFVNTDLAGFVLQHIK